MIRKIVSIFIIAFSLLSCSSSVSETTQKPLVLSTDVWIGAAPIYYAREMGWLREAGIEMLQARSINENMQMFESGASDIFTGTQHEYAREQKNYPDLVPVIIYDRSYGGDVVMANRTIEELQASSGKIDIYLESDSVSEELLQYLTGNEKLAKERLIIHHRSQDEMIRMKNTPLLSSTVVITYNPHDLALKKNGFFEIASSKDERYLVIDAIYTSQKTCREHSERLKKLSDILSRSLKAYEEDPKGFYEKVKAYLGNPSYEEFSQMRGNIQWIDNKPSPQMKKRLEEIAFPIQDLIE